MRRLGLMAGCGVAALCLATPAHAQRTEENVTTQSADAFGRGVGSERSGLYSQDDTRGFNPMEAGNVRLQGLYIDLIERVSNRLVEGSTIRVGYAAQRYPFPAPTGLVDYRLVLPRNETRASLDFDLGNSIAQGPGGNLMVELPIAGERLGFAGGAGFRKAVTTEGVHNLFLNYSALLAFRPAPDAEILVFSSGISSLDDEARPSYFPAATALPPRLPRGKFLGLDWTSADRHNFTHGAMARLAIAPGWRVESGLFLATKSQPTSFADLFTGVDSNGLAANRTVIADVGNSDRSLSGELRLVHEWKSGDFSHSLTASLRGRKRDKRFGGSSRRALGPGSIFADSGWSEPAFAFGPKNDDHVRQLTPGIAWSGIWKGKASIDLSLAKSFYRKSVDFADPQLADPVTRDRPLLFNASTSLAITPRLVAYAGYARGLEEAQVAPEIASNRSEAPPALRTRQAEAGLRFAITDHASVIAGVFTITKPYLNLDPALRYRQLGTLNNRGIELSLTGQVAPGLTLVGGTLFLDPRISGEGVDTGLIGPRPVGQIRRRSTLNVDWRLDGGKSPLSFDLALDSQSARMANAANTLVVPARSLVTLSARYRFTIGSVRLVARAQVMNLFDTYSWQVTSSGGMTYVAPRKFGFNLIADF